jgi:nitrite reductase (NO-forming)
VRSATRPAAACVVTASRVAPMRDRPTAAATNDRTGPTGRRGAPRRVADVHVQTRRCLVVTAAFVSAAVVVGVAGIGAGWWLPLHLFVVGGLLSAISAVTQMLAVTWSAAPAPQSRVAAAQRWVLAAGTVALLVGRETDRPWLIVAGGTMVVVAMLALAVILVGVRRQAVTPRFGPAIDAYLAAIVAGAAGMSVGILLGAGRAGRRAGELRDAHLVLNLYGLLGLVVAGTLPYFAATQVRSRMAPLATPTAMRLTFAALGASTVVGAAGHLAGRPNVVAGGLFAYVLGLLAIAAMLPVYTRSRLRWAGPRVVQLVAGVAWWGAMTVALAVGGVRGTADRRVLQALVIGGFAQILVASLAYLGPVLRGGGYRNLTAGFAITRSWVSLAAGNIAAVAALVGQLPTLAIASAIWLGDMTVRAARLLGRPPTGRDRNAGGCGAGGHSVPSLP